MNYYEQIEQKVKLIEYIVQSDTHLLDKIDFSTSCIMLKKEGNKDAKKCEESTSQNAFSKSLLDTCTEFYDNIAHQLEESQTFLDRLETTEMTPEMIRLQLGFQIKSLQNSSTQFLLNLERQLKTN